jgi:hypothetical protein
MQQEGRVAIDTKLLSGTDEVPEIPDPERHRIDEYSKPLYINRLYNIKSA